MLNTYMCVYIYSFKNKKNLFHCGLSQDMEYSSLCYPIVVLIVRSWRKISFSFIPHTKFFRRTFPCGCPVLTISSSFYHHLREEGKLRSKVTEEKKSWMHCLNHPHQTLMFQENSLEKPKSSQTLHVFPPPTAVSLPKRGITSNLQSRSIGKDSEAGKD